MRITFIPNKKGVFQMFEKLYQKRDANTIVSPADGEFIRLENVPDPIFSAKLVGEGFAIHPSTGRIASPVDGQIINTSETNHIISVRNAEGIDVLIHVGLETVSLRGKGFKRFVELGQHVKKGEPLLEFDLEYLKDNAYSTLISTIFTNIKNRDFALIWKETGELIAGETKIVLLVEK